MTVADTRPAPSERPSLRGATSEIQLTRRYVGEPGRQVHLLEGGAGAGTPLWCLHATAYSGRSFAPFLQAMAAHRPVVAADTPGYGGSDAPSRLPDIEDYAARIDTAMDAAGAGQIDLFGYHTGAVIAAEMARRRPDRVRRLILIGVPFFQGHEREVWRTRLAQPHMLRETLDQFAERWDFLVTRRMNGVTLRRAFDNFVDELRGYPNGWWAHEAAFRFDLDWRLPCIGQPTLVINPANHLAEASRRAAAAIPRAEVVELDWLNGALFDVAPEELAARMEAFLREGADPFGA